MTAPAPLPLLAALALWLAAALPAQAPTAPIAPTATPMASEAAVRTLLQQLDDCFERGDLDGYRRAFSADHPGAQAVLAHQLERRFAAAPTRARRSTLVGAPQVIGPRTIVRVAEAIRLGPADAPLLEVVEHTLLALRVNGDGRVAPTLAVAVPPASRGAPTAPFRCEACNYHIGGASGWLCAPTRPETARALEGATLYLLGSDLACDVSVDVDPDALVASAVVQRLGAAMQRLEPRARALAVEPWRPPHHDDLPTGLTGARLQFELPGPGSGDRAVFHVVAFGGLQHVLLLRGSAASLGERQAEVQQLLASYRLLELDAVRVDAAIRSLSHHTGGRFEGSVYRNTAHGVELRGPAGWPTQQRAGGTQFRVGWQSPHGSRLWLTGHRVPIGITRWTTAAADRWLAELCDQQQIDVVADPQVAGADTAWSPAGDCGGPTRWLRAVPRGSAPAPVPRQRWIRVQVHDDLLLLADGHANTTDEEQQLRAAMLTLRRQ